MIRTYKLIGCVVLASVFGCAQRPELIPNSDPALNKKSTELAADAAKRFPYKSDAPRGGTAKGRCQVGYTLDKLEIANQSDTDWNDVEVWVNQSYVVHLPLLKAHAEKVTSIPFQALFNDKGRSFPTDNSKVRVDKVEVYYGGTMYDVPKQLAD